MMYLPDIVTGGRLRLAEGGMVDISVAETFEVKRNLWLGSSKLNLVWAPVKGRWGKNRYEKVKESFYLSLHLRILKKS